MYLSEEEINKMMNPEGWVVKETQSGDTVSIEMQNDSGQKYRAVLDYSCTISKIKSTILFTDVYGRSIFYKTVWDFADKEQLHEDIYYNEETSLIAFWAIQNRMPPEVAKCIWRRANVPFAYAVNSALLFRYEQRYLKENGRSVFDDFPSKPEPNGDAKQGELL